MYENWLITFVLITMLADVVGNVSHAVVMTTLLPYILQVETMVDIEFKNATAWHVM